MAIPYIDEEGVEGTVKCPLLRMAELQLRHLGQMKGQVEEGHTEEWETDCQGGQCGAYGFCFGEVVPEMVGSVGPAVAVRGFEGRLRVSGVVETRRGLNVVVGQKAQCPKCGRTVGVNAKTYKFARHYEYPVGQKRRVCPGSGTEWMASGAKKHQPKPQQGGK